MQEWESLLAEKESRLDNKEKKGDPLHFYEMYKRSYLEGIARLFFFSLALSSFGA